MSRYHAQPNTIPPGTAPLPALNRVLEAIDAKDVITQLAVLSDDQLINDTQLHVALLCQPDTLMRLLELEDLYVQFSAYRLVKAILLNHNDVFAIISAIDNNSQTPPLLRNNRQLVIRILVQKLVKINQSCSGTGRVILELFHGLLKDHRHLVRNLGYHDNDLADDSEEEEDVMLAVSQHVALTVMEELMACSEFRDGAVLNRILGCREMQYAALVLMIDIEKARVFGAAGAGDGFWKSVISCHKCIVQCIDEWIAKDRIGLLPLKKHLELICISMKPSSPSQQQWQEISVGRDMRRALEVLIALSPLLLDTLRKFQEQDPDLEDFSAGRTTFIIPDNPTNASLSNTPEAVRQLGQICLTAVLFILDNLDLSDDADEKGDGIRNNREHIIELTSRYLIPFLEEWLGDRTLPLLLTVYGEDDAGISWLLRALSRNYRNILVLQSSSSLHPSSLTHTPSSVSTTATPTVSSRSAALLLDKVQELLEKHAHPVESLFRFLETVGFDYQTILDLLLTLDDHESGGMLAAVMAILRSFTEDTNDQRRIVQRWHQEIQDQQLQCLQQEQAQDQEEQRLELLNNVDHCLTQLSLQIRRLYKNNLFPYNPKPLLHVLDLTQDILSTVLIDS